MLDLGFTADEIRGMLGRPLLHPRHRGVYALGALSPAPEARWAAALLAAGEGAVLSHKSAAALWGLLPIREVVEVTVSTQRRGDGGLRVHRTRGRVETTHHKALRVTTIPQTLLDLAATGWPIDRLTHEAAAASLVSLDALKTFAANRRGARGAAKLNEALGLPHTRSGWERRFVRWLKTLDGIPMPGLNDVIDGLTVDLHWPDHDLVVELDTEQTHGTPWAQERDRRRDERLRHCGKTVIRIREERFDPGAVEPELRARLRAPARPSRCSGARR
jgi:hypothetical protein